MKKVSEVSKLAGISIRTLQYYDDNGLLPVKRLKDNYRIYDEETLQRLWKILVYREMHFSLKEIKYLLDLPDSEQKQYCEKHIENLHEQIAFAQLISNGGMLPVPPEITIGEMSYMEYLSEFRKTLFQ